MHRRDIKLSKYITVLAITTLIFVFGIILGNYSAGKKLSQIDSLNQKLKTDTVAIEVQYDLLKEEPCRAVNISSATKELYELSEKLDYMENKLGANNRDVLTMKEYYQLLEVRHWLLMKEIYKNCGTNRTFILFFYSNKEDCASCEEQGFILSWMRKNHDNINVYAFDYHIENIALKSLKELYGVNQTPFVIINDKNYAGFQTKNQIEAVI